MYNITFYIVIVSLVPLSLPLFDCVCRRDSRLTPRLTESPLPTLFIHGPARFVNSLPRFCQLSFGRGSRGIIFKGDNFVRFMGDTFARGGRSTSTRSK